MSNENFKFAFSLEVLNHLGRGLYRNFATVIAEAVSNSWDAEAENVRLTIKGKTLIIEDDGKGMDSNDFKDRFLKVGYSRRGDTDNESNRKVLGRKGIGKLAMLSISKKVTVISKKENKSVTGGIIDNTRLDEGIKSDSSYTLGNLENHTKVNEDDSSGTKIIFEEIKSAVNNPDVIKKYLATLFNFSLSSPNETFNLFVNDNQVTDTDLKQLNSATQFLWTIGSNTKFNKNIKKKYLQLVGKNNLNAETFKINNKEYEISGYVASVKVPKDLKIHGTGSEFKAGLHLFVNGRLRQENIFSDIASQRIVESYLYGEIHVDGFDDGDDDGDDCDDIFTSNREGVIKDTDIYQEFLKSLRNIQSSVLNGWDEMRNKINKDKGEQNLKDNNSSLNHFNNDKRNIIEKFMNEQEGDGLKEKAIKVITQDLPPERSDIEILLSHSSEDSKYANIIYELLLYCGFEKKKILYTTSENPESRIPGGTHMSKHIKQFFVNDWYDKPPIFFVISKKMEKSWWPVIEAGAAWATTTKHSIVVTDEGHEPKSPLNPDDHVYISFCNKNSFFNVFKLYKHDLNEAKFKNKLEELMSSLQSK